MKWRLPILLLMLGAALFAANVKLYMKDGTFQVVREYQVLQDRVKYFSTERADWEEIPLELVDLNRTKQEAAAQEDLVKQEAKDDSDERKALLEDRQQASYVPDDPGAYYVHGDKLDPVKQAEINITNDKKRVVLKILSPIPVVSGKNTVELTNEASQFRVEGDRPEFYFRLHGVNGFDIIKLAPKKNARLVETVTVQAVTNERSQQRDVIATFKKQSGDLLYKIWPEKPMLPGEYALIEYGVEEDYLQVWDFGVGPASRPGSK